MSERHSVQVLVLIVTRGRFHSAIVAGVSAHGVVEIGLFSFAQRGVARGRSILLLFSVTISISFAIIVLEKQHIHYPDMPAVVMPIAPGKPGM